MTILSRARRVFSGCLSLALLLASVPQSAYAAVDKISEVHGIHTLHLPLGQSKPFAPRAVVPGAVNQGVEIKTSVLAPVAVLPSATAGAQTAAEALPTIRFDDSSVFFEGANDDVTGDGGLTGAAKKFRAVDGIADGERIAGALDNIGGAFRGHVAPDGFGNAEPPTPQGTQNAPAEKTSDTGKPAAALEPTAPAAVTPAAAEVPAAPAASNSSAVVTTVKEAWHQGLILLGAQLIAQIGVEAWSAVWNKWVQVNYGMNVYTMTTMAGMATSLLAGYVGGWVADKVGDKRAAVFAWYGVAAVSAATLWFAGAGMLGTPLLIGMLVGRLFVTGAGNTAEKTLPITVFKDHKGELGKYNSIAQTTLEVAGIFVPSGISILIGMLGMLGTMWILPVAMATGATFMLMLLKVSKSDRVKLTADGAAAPRETNPALLTLGRWLYPLLSLRNLLLYSAIAIGFGNMLFPGTDHLAQQAANGFAGQIVGLYSAGGLLAGLWLSGLIEKGWGWVQSKFPKLPSMPSPDETEAGEVRAASKWLVIGGIAGVLAFLPMVLTTSPWIILGGLVLVGLTDVISTLQVLALIQKNTPQERKGKVMGLVRTTVTLGGLVGFFAFSQLFKYFAAGASAAVTLPLIGLTIPAAVVPLVPFYAFIALNALLAAYFIFMSRKLKAKIPAAPAAGSQG